MNGKRRACIVLIVLMVLSALMQACLAWGPPVIYKKNDTDLYSVAIHSLAGVYSSGLDEILVLDEDEYGRKLFFANLGRSSLLGDISGIFISQNTDVSYAYYYEDRNYIIKSGSVNKVSKETVYGRFSPEEINTLKAQNDWGKEARSRECFKVPKTGDKFYLRDELSDEKINSVGETIFIKKKGDTPMCEDSFGSLIWFMQGYVSDEPKTMKYYVVFFNADGTVKGDDAIMEIKDIWDYRDQLIAFKEVNHWNKAE